MQRNLVNTLITYRNDNVFRMFVSFRYSSLFSLRPASAFASHKIPLFHTILHWYYRFVILNIITRSTPMAAPSINASGSLILITLSLEYIVVGRDIHYKMLATAYILPQSRIFVLSISY